MNRKTAIILAIAAVSLIIFGGLLGQTLVTAQERQRAAAAAAIGSGFSYQGHLDDSGVPAGGSYDFQFTLYDDPAAGAQVGSMIPQTLSVNDGLFNTNLDFGATAFDGEARYLEVAVQLNGGGGFTTLSPRQAITAVPYASFAAKVQPLENVVKVAKSGGDYTSVQDALDSITTATAANPFLIRVAPGVYTGTVDLKSYVDIEGSGEGVTILRGIGGAYAHPGATVKATSPVTTELRALTVESIAADPADFAIAITLWGAGSGVRLTQITAYASGGVQNYGVINALGSSPTMKQVSSIPSGTVGFGIYNITNASPLMVDMIIGDPGGSTGNALINGDNSWPTLRNATVTGLYTAISNDGNSGTMVTGSQLVGTVVANFTCFDSFDGLGQVLDSICQPITSGDTLAWRDLQGPERVIWVAESGGDYTSVSDALDAITDASIHNPYVIRIAPGVYSETTGIDMQAYVDIEGSGESVTTIRGFGSDVDPSVDGSSATVRSTGNITAELRFLTVESIGTGKTDGVPIWTKDGTNALKLTHVTAVGYGGEESYGVRNWTSAPVMTHVTARAVGTVGSTDFAYGVLNRYSSKPVMDNVTATASGAYSESLAVVNNTNSAPLMNNVTAHATGPSLGSVGVFNYESLPVINDLTAVASGGTDVNIGLTIYYNSSLTMTNATITAEGPAVENIGIQIFNSSPFLQNVTVRGAGGTDNFGILLYDSPLEFLVTDLRDSFISGTTAAFRNDGSLSGAFIANSMFEGTIDGSGDYYCLNNYDYAFYVPLNCP